MNKSTHHPLRISAIRARHRAPLAALWLAGLASCCSLTAAQEPAAGLGDDALLQVRQLADEASRKISAPGNRVEVQVGELDPRLRLAPCEKVQPYLPAGTRLWGKTRIGLRCVQGPKAWNVYLPLSVKVFAPALVAAGTLPAGSVLGEADLRVAEVDLAAEPGAAIARAELALGRTLSRPLERGDALRQTDLKARQWFAAGEQVRIVAVGNGYAVTGEGTALSPGLEGQRVRVRTEGGRIVTGLAVSERRVEVAL